MATQLKHTEFAYTPAPTPRPNIRIAFLAGEAATAVHDAMAKLPADTRDGTLEDLVCDQGVGVSADIELIQSMTCMLIETARELLSPRMYTAFLRWGETAAHLSSFYESDEEGEVRCRASGDALRAMAVIPAENAHDMMFRAMLTGLEAGDCSSFGPFEVETSEHVYPLEVLSKGLGNDLASLSPIAGAFEQLSTRAWALSNSKSSFSSLVGGAIASAFSFARGEDDPQNAPPRPVKMDGYDRFMRGPLIQWQRAYDRYSEIKTEADRFHQEIVLPAHARFEAVRGKWPADYDFATDPAAQAEIDAVDYCDLEERGDAFWGQLYDAKVRLYLTPAPSSCELAIKLKVFVESRDSDLTRSDEVIEQMMFDARRFGRHGAHLQTDQRLLDAFTARRHEFEAAGKGPWTAEQEDAYFARVDAAEMVLLDTRATTLEGAIAKLRVAFMNQYGSDWSDLAISNTADPKFVEGLRMAGMYERMAWGAIEDLCRIAGVSLAEQGA